MSRITGNDAKGLMEAYGAVYTPQELTEEQVWEEVETWVNSLLEEGYDLSDYTWEEMYESYIEEQGRGRSSGASPGSLGYKPKPMGTETGRQLNQVFGQGNKLFGSAPRNTPAPGTRQNLRGGGSRPDPRAAARPSSSPKPQIASLPSSARQVTQYPQGVSTGVGGGNAGASRPPTPASRPAATSAAAPRPAAPAPAARPAAGAPAAARPAAPATPGVTTVPIRPRTPAAAPAPAARTPGATPAPATTKVAPAPAGGSALDRATAAASTPAAFSPKPQSDVGAMIARSQARQAAQTPKPATPAPAARPMGSARERMLQRQSFDVFDVIKGHLIDEGYADTEESALVIMANMSESWKNSIIG
jgi:hypothetical protein